MMGWRRFGIDSVVSLLTEEEERELDLEDEASVARRHNLNFVSYPISDRGIPGTTTVDNFLEAIDLDLLRGKSVLVHCRQGIGRTGLVAASLLIREGEKPQSAIQEVTRARGLRIPETAEQEDWIYRVGASVK
jgi:protein-tyrosine phosphatase